MVTRADWHGRVGDRGLAGRQVPRFRNLGDRPIDVLMALSRYWVAGRVLAPLSAPDIDVQPDPPFHQCEGRPECMASNSRCSDLLSIRNSAWSFALPGSA